MKRLVFLLEEMSTQKFLMNFLPELGFRKEEYLFPKIYQGKRTFWKILSVNCGDGAFPAFVSSCLWIKTGMNAATRRSRKQ